MGSWDVPACSDLGGEQEPLLQKWVPSSKDLL